MCIYLISRFKWQKGTCCGARNKREQPRTLRRHRAAGWTPLGHSRPAAWRAPPEETAALIYLLFNLHHRPRFPTNTHYRPFYTELQLPRHPGLAVPRNISQASHAPLNRNPTKKEELSSIETRPDTVQGYPYRKPTPKYHHVQRANPHQPPSATVGPCDSVGHPVSPSIPHAPRSYAHS